MILPCCFIGMAAAASRIRRRRRRRARTRYAKPCDRPEGCETFSFEGYQLDPSSRNGEGVWDGARVGHRARRAGRASELVRTSQFQFRVTPNSEEEACRDLEILIDAYAETNLAYLLSLPPTVKVPCCVGCFLEELRYVPPQTCRGNRFCQDLYDLHTIFRKKKCTCADGVAGAIAISAYHGMPARAHVSLQRHKPGLMHCVMEKGNGQVLDVQTILEQGGGGCEGAGCSCGGKH